MIKSQIMEKISVVFLMLTFTTLTSFGFPLVKLINLSKTEHVFNISNDDYPNKISYEQNKILLNKFKTNNSIENFKLLPTKKQAQELLKLNFNQISSRGGCPSGQTAIRLNTFEPIDFEEEVSTERIKEMFQFAYSDGNCIYIIHVVYNPGILGLFPSEPYGCMELVGCL